MKRIDRLKEEVEVFTKAVKYLTRYKTDKCKGYAPGCVNCAHQLLLGYIYDHLWFVEDELKEESNENKKKSKK